MMTFKTEKLPTTTAHQSRLRLFQATRRPKNIEELIDTAWGKIRLKGKLGQQHADILEAILSTAERHAKIEDGRIKLLIDPYQVMKTSHQTSWGTFKKNLDDLMQAIIEIKEPTDLWCIGHLIDNVDVAKRRDGTKITKPNPLDGGEREMWRVEIGKVGSMLIENDLKLYYKTDSIAALDHGISQAIARHVLTHKLQPNGGWHLDALIKQVAGEMSSTLLRHRRREVRSDAAELATIGVQVSQDGDRVACSKSAVIP